MTWLLDHLIPNLTPRLCSLNHNERVHIRIMVSASGGQQSTLNIAFMLLLGMLLVSSALGDGNATQDAVVTVDNPMLAFEALMPDTLDVARGGIVGSVAAYGNENGVGITFEIQLDQFPDYDTYGPFCESLLLISYMQDG